MRVPEGWSSRGPQCLTQLLASMRQSRTATAATHAAEHIPGIGLPKDDQQSMAAAAAATGGVGGGIGGSRNPQRELSLSQGAHVIAASHPLSNSIHYRSILLSDQPCELPSVQCCCWLSWPPARARAHPFWAVRPMPSVSRALFFFPEGGAKIVHQAGACLPAQQPRPLSLCRPPRPLRCFP